MSKAQRILFLWWGRRGAIARLLLDAFEAASRDGAVKPLLSVSRSTARIEEFRKACPELLEIETFSSSVGAFTRLWRILPLRRTLAAYLVRQQVDAVVVLMSHVWTPLVASAVRRCGIPYIVVVHDAATHPGDLSGKALGWLTRDTRFADRVVTLSQSVAEILVATKKAPPERLRVLFHPEYVSSLPLAPPSGQPLRALFLGRIMAYKGLPIFVETLELLRDRGIAIRASVVGEGNLEPYRARLLACGADIWNAWVTDVDIDKVLASHDVVVLTHTEASQSGVAAVAFGAGLPIVATPVGGLREQVAHGRTGLLAERIDAAAVADCLQRLVTEAGLLAVLRAGVAASKSERSMARFVSAIAAIAAEARR